MFGDIQTFAFGFFRYTQSHDHVDQLEQHETHHTRQEHHRAHAPRLAHQLRGHVEVTDLAGGVVEHPAAAKLGIDHDSGADRGDDAADRVHAEHVQRIVVTH